MTRTLIGIFLFPLQPSLLLGLLGRDPLCYDCLAALHLYGSSSRLGQNLYWTLSLFFLVCVIRTRILVHSAVYHLRDLRHIPWPSHSFSRTIGSDSVKAPRPLCCTEPLGYAQWQTLFLWLSLELRWRNQPSFYKSLCRCCSEYPNLQNPFLPASHIHTWLQTLWAAVLVCPSRYLSPGGKCWAWQSWGWSRETGRRGNGIDAEIWRHIEFSL